jgi:hypothetical protein
MRCGYRVDIDGEQRATMQVNVSLRVAAFIAAGAAWGCSVEARDFGAGMGGDAGSSAQGGQAGTGMAGSAMVGGSAGSGGDGGGGAGGGSGSGVVLDGGADASDTGAGGSSSGTFCDTQTPTNGVAAADFQGLDFETAVGAQWTTLQTGTATVATTTERAFSPTNSLRAEVPDAPDFAGRTQAALHWTGVGATAIAGASVALQVNPVGFAGVTPDWTGSVILACIEYGTAGACLHYAKSGTPTALFVEWIYSGGPAVLGTCDISEALDFNLWNAVELSVGSADDVHVSINGVEGTSACNGNFGADTAAEVTVGLQTRNTTEQGWTVYFDDVVVEVQR